MNGLVFIVDYYVDYQLYEGNFFFFKQKSQSIEWCPKYCSLRTYLHSWSPDWFI